MMSQAPVHRSTKKSVKHPGRQELLTSLPRVERVLPYMPDQRVCKRCGKKTVVIDYQESSQSDAEVAKYFVLVEEFSAKLCVWLVERIGCTWAAQWRDRRSWRLKRGLQVVKRPRTPRKSAITSDNIEVKGSPVSQQYRLVPLSLICLDVSAAGIAVVDPQARLSLNRHDRKSVIVFTLTERTTGSPVAPT